MPGEFVKQQSRGKCQVLSKAWISMERQQIVKRHTYIYTYIQNVFFLET